MVRINLISAEQGIQKRKRVAIVIQNQLILGSVLLSVVVLILGVVWILLDRRISSLEIEKTAKLEELAILKAQVQEVENYERDKKTVLERIDVIHKLREHQALPVQLLDGVSRGIPARVWLTVLRENTGKVEIEGRSMTNGEIVDFVSRLKENPMFRAVELLESRQEKEMGVSVYSFKLTFSLSPQEEKPS